MLQVRENEISLRNSSGGPEYLRTQRKIADGAMQMDVNNSLNPFYTTKEMPHVTVTITRNAVIARYISIMTTYTVGYLQIFNTGHFFSIKHYHDL